ncbi:cellulose binding domain-containing protein [Salinactinospora qingdaonensis]|uniref:CBM2 domain-containing protein n=1 Tax=Salinactinospora qingdaonensis TaxID=702744 RepID=A0ABP7FR79_9ACTN
MGPPTEEAEGGQRGAHRAEPQGSGPLATVGHVLGSTVPKRVQPPRLLRVLLISGMTIGLCLFGYSTTQIYLRFTEPPASPGANGEPDFNIQVEPTSGEMSPSATPEVDARATVEAQSQSPSPEPTSVEESTEQADDQRSQSPQQTSQQQDQQQEDADHDDQATATAAGAQSGASASVSYSTVTYSDSGFGGQVVITNNGESTIEDWRLRLSFSDVTVTAAWEADWQSTGKGIIARKPDWKSGIAPGESTTLSFTAEGEAQPPTDCSFNGASCGL